MDCFAVCGMVGVTHASRILADPTLEVLATSAMLSDGETAVENL
tara:strand:- start:331 stop:462 length:132 start_codon:yes stop_codon:yes gene_type:complete